MNLPANLPQKMVAEEQRPRPPDRTGLWVGIGVVAITLAAIVFILQLPPRTSVNESTMKAIEGRLFKAGFVSTNVTHMHSQAMFGPFPISKILGTDKHGVNMPMTRGPDSLSLSYDLKRGKAFNIFINANEGGMAMANVLAADLRKENPSVSLTIWTNSSK